MMNLIFKIYHY